MNELFGIPVVYDRNQPSKVVSVFQFERTCKCAPATLVHIVCYPITGVQCACGAVWPAREEKKINGNPNSQ